MHLKVKDCDEPTLDEGPEPGSRWTMEFDGAVNQYGNGIGAVIITPQSSHIPFTARLTFKCTNNMAEYEACIMGLEECIDLRIKYLDVYGDSALVINQIKGEWETNQPSLIPYRDWHEMQPFALHGYLTSVRTSIGATPYSLVYGMEAVLPVEVEIPSLISGIPLSFCYG